MNVQYNKEQKYLVNKEYPISVDSVLFIKSCIISDLSEDATKL